MREIAPADAPSQVVAEQVRAGVAVGPCLRFPYAADVPTVDARRHYGLRAHVDLDGDGRVSPGDPLSMVSQPVLTFGAPDHADLPLALVQPASTR